MRKFSKCLLVSVSLFKHRTSTTWPIVMNLSGLFPGDKRDINKRLGLGLAHQTPDSGMLHTRGGMCMPFSFSKG